MPKSFSTYSVKLPPSVIQVKLRGIPAPLATPHCSYDGRGPSRLRMATVISAKTGTQGPKGEGRRLTVTVGRRLVVFPAPSGPPIGGHHGDVTKVRRRASLSGYFGRLDGSGLNDVMGCLRKDVCGDQLRFGCCHKDLPARGEASPQNTFPARRVQL